MRKRKKEHNSAIEMLKIFAILCIICTHIIQTVTTKDLCDSTINISSASFNPTVIVLLLLRHLGILGNTIFLVSSSWFLLKSKRYSRKKEFRIIAETWCISVLILIISLIVINEKISLKNILKSLFPTILANNWYVTCYLIFYPLHPILNRVIGESDKKQLFRMTFILFTLNILFDFLKKDLFFPSKIILWISIYFMVAFMQKYMDDFSKSRKKNLKIFILNIVFFAFLIFLTEYAGLHIPKISNKMTYWVNDCNPFLIFMAISLFNLAKSFKIKNRIINYISGFSLLIYIIHENLIVRLYFRPKIWNFIYHNYGYSRVFIWLFVLVASTFVIALLCSIIFSAVSKKTKLFDRLYNRLRRWYLSLEKVILNRKHNEK